MANEVNQQKVTINNLEQYSRRDCLEIKGIPVHSEGSSRSDDLNDIVLKVANTIGVQMDMKDISVVHRLPRRRISNVSESSDNLQEHQPPNVIVKFVRREVRDNFYRARRNLKDKSARNLGFTSTNLIFVSESLTEMNKNLFNKCLKVRRDLGFKFIWTHMGKIKLRKDERSPVVNIHSIDDIQKIQVNH